MTEAPLEPSAARTALLLARAAVVIWFISLLLPAFIAETRTEPAYGGLVLLMGLLFGWAVFGWAAYANLLFPYVVIRLFQRKATPIATPVMLALALTTFFFQGVLRDEGTGIVLPVASWGWGAVLWGFSLLLAGVAVGILLRWYGNRGALRIVTALGIGILAVGATHMLQRGLANTQEREIYLPLGMAFATAAFCGKDFVWPEKPQVPRDETVALDIEDALKAPRSPYLSLPQLMNAQDGEYQWRTYRDFGLSSSSVKVRSLAKSARYSLQARRVADGAVIRILDSASNENVYEQPLRSRLVRRLQNHYEYCPFSTQQWEGLRKGYDTAILRALNQEPTKDRGTDILHPEAARIPCNLGYADIGGVKGLRAWDGREVILEPPSMLSRAGFCSERYIGLVYVSMRGESAQDDLIPVVTLYDRNTLRPLGAFSDRRSCPTRKRCAAVPNSMIKGFRVDSNETVIVETTSGELKATRFVIN